MMTVARPPAGDTSPAPPRREPEAAQGHEDLPSFMNVRQVARYLHINEKKVYALLREGKIPATKITGKWLFPRQLIDQWLLESTHGGVFADRLILCGSDDPLLHRLVSSLADDMQDRAVVLYTPTGTRLGLSLLAQRRANACAVHWGPASESHNRHPALLRNYPHHKLWVLVRIFRREQGLMISPRIGRADTDPGALLSGSLRWVLRQQGAGSQRYLQEVLQSHDIRMDTLNVVQHAYSEREAASLIAMGQADIAPGVRSGAAEFGLDFIPVGWEAFDLALYRDIYFRALFQQVLKTLKGRAIAATAVALGGYDLSEAGSLVWAS